jgi:uncharacterized protein YkwD
MRSIQRQHIVAVALAALIGAGWFHDGARRLLSVEIQDRNAATSPDEAAKQWKSLLASDSICPGADDASGSDTEQRDAIVCLVNYIRSRRALPQLRYDTRLEKSSRAKAHLIVRCGEYSHTPCGRPADEVAKHAGYPYGMGENLFLFESASPASPRAAIGGWLGSDGHRANLFNGRYRAHGVARVRPETFRDEEDAVIWVHQFGVR